MHLLVKRTIKLQIKSYLSSVIVGLWYVTMQDMCLYEVVKLRSTVNVSILFQKFFFFFFPDVYIVFIFDTHRLPFYWLLEFGNELHTHWIMGIDAVILQSGFVSNRALFYLDVSSNALKNDALLWRTRNLWSSPGQTGTVLVSLFKHLQCIPNYLVLSLLFVCFQQQTNCFQISVVFKAFFKQYNHLILYINV